MWLRRRHESSTEHGDLNQDALDNVLGYVAIIKNHISSQNTSNVMTFHRTEIFGLWKP